MLLASLSLKGSNMPKRLVIAGSGFAGTWAAIAGARARALADRVGELEIVVVSPSPTLPIRPRFYEPELENLAPDISGLLAEMEVGHLPGLANAIDAGAQKLTVARKDGTLESLAYDRLVLATGSSLAPPAVPGAREHAFTIDQEDEAWKLDAHLRALAARPDSLARNTVVVVGAGFTGIELACDLPQRLRAVLGAEVDVRVVLLEQGSAVGPSLGAGPRPIIEQALTACGVTVRLNETVASIDASGARTSRGERIEACTVVWTTGTRAHPLAQALGTQHDEIGRIRVDDFLRVPGVEHLFATGDTACAAVDDAGHHSLPSCQHALSLGRVAGYNGVASLLDLPLHAYRQPKYVTCLDLGPWGAVLTDGWSREVQMSGAEAKALKRDINTIWIYPPTSRAAAFEQGAPDHVIVA